MTENHVTEIVFIGLGLHDELGLTLRGLKEAKTADTVFIEQYTSVMPNFSVKRLEHISGKKIHRVSRKMLEEENGKIILDAAKAGKAALLVPGDPFIATTHVTLRMKAKEDGINVRIVHGVSIVSAVIGLSGLHSYKFGKSVTIPFPDETPAITPYNIIAQNKAYGLHTLCLLDIKTKEKKYLTINEGLKALMTVEAMRGEGVITKKTVVIGVAKAGSSNPQVKADFIDELIDQNFGSPPFSIIFPGELHFTEAEALIHFAAASKTVVDSMKGRYHQKG